MARPIAIGAAASLVAALLASPGVGAGTAKSRVIDLTIRCPVSLMAGIRELHVNAQAGVRDQGDPSKWFALPEVSLYSGPLPSVSLGVRGGRPEQSTTQDSRRFTLWMNDDACRPASTTVALSPKGLPGGAASQLLQRFECVVPRRILIRVRANFRSPTSLQRGGFTATPLKSGYLAVRSEAGKPLVYAEVFESGKARLFLAGNCVRD